ncbi:MAG TPA: hypothetical protein VKK79_01140 [Candidatus Lokiarchaeia archaeon]|nr:hypothetical protein [Candidatus Lokiarchaeia archaeon]
MAVATSEKNTGRKDVDKRTFLQQYLLAVAIAAVGGIIISDYIFIGIYFEVWSVVCACAYYLKYGRRTATGGGGEPASDAGAVEEQRPPD